MGKKGYKGDVLALTVSLAAGLLITGALIYGSERRRVSDFEALHQNVLKREWEERNAVPTNNTVYARSNTGYTGSTRFNEDRGYPMIYNTYQPPKYNINIPQTNQAYASYNTATDPMIPHFDEYNRDRDAYRERTHAPVQAPLPEHVQEPAVQAHEVSPVVSPVVPHAVTLTPPDIASAPAHPTPAHVHAPPHAPVGPAPKSLQPQTVNPYRNEDTDDEENKFKVVPPVPPKQLETRHTNQVDHVSDTKHVDHTIIANITATIIPPPPPPPPTPKLTPNPKGNVIFDPVPGLFPRILVDRVLKEREVEVIVHGPKKQTRVFSV